MRAETLILHRDPEIQTILNVVTYMYGHSNRLSDKLYKFRMKDFIYKCFHKAIYQNILNSMDLLYPKLSCDMNHIPGLLQWSKS